MPKGRGANARRRTRRQRIGVLLTQIGDPDVVHRNRMARMTHGLGVKGPCTYADRDHPHRRR